MSSDVKGEIQTGTKKWQLNTGNKSLPSEGDQTEGISEEENTHIIMASIQKFTHL